MTEYEPTNKYKPTLKMIAVAIPEFAWQIASRFVVRMLGIIAGFFVCLLSAFSVRDENRFGESSIEHNSHYRIAGSSGRWDYERLPFSKPGQIFWMWNNDEDGLLGEPSGRWSYKTQGKERSFKNKYIWSAIRNPFNNASRYTDMFGVNVNHLDIYWLGDIYVNAKYNARGWHFVIGVDKFSKKRYYGLAISINKWLGCVVGYKLRPTHFLGEEEPDDFDKGWTARGSLWFMFLAAIIALAYYF